ncbi:acetate--CoA ligase [Lebetimonas sp. JS138]|uniref:acetate--CoA ligase n=1 Tax=Lebetimonas sp. JS138 TaxID=990072 RepID=UPI000463F4C4|nr:acetate--CoA ligase [Lebetimonas sp. JS138]
MTSEIYYPHKELFKNPVFKSMDDYREMVEKFEKDFEGTWAKLAKEKITWFKEFEQVLDESNAPFYKWFVGGKLNVTFQCIDRHLEDKKNKAAIIWEGDNGENKTITYLQLYKEVNKFANLLKNFGVQKGDRVVIYMPMIPEAAYAMLACARIGAIHSVVFGGFSAEALKDRIIDANAKIVITADGAFRKGAPYMLKPTVDKALEGIDFVEKVIVVERNNEDIDWIEGRDVSYNELIQNQSSKCDPEVMDSEDPLFLLYTSGSTGKPKGVQHSQAGYILHSQLTMEWVFDIKDNDTFWCTADIGWITGHTYIVYGPLAAGATTVMFEGVATYPDAGRAWKMVENYKINQFYTAPTAIRLLHKIGADEPKKYDLSSLRILGTVGEPIDPAAWKWYYEVVGNNRCSIVDTWWQTETGGHMISPLPAATPIKPGSATFPLPGIFAEIIDENGNKMPENEKGLLCITKPWPSMIRTIWGDPERFVKSYFSTAKKNGKAVYFSGDGAIYDKDGYIWITGRVDDVINVSGHRLGTAEIEDAVKFHPEVAEVAVVGKPDEIKGESVFAYIVLKNPENIAEELEFIKEVNEIIKREIGAIATVDNFAFVPGLPKTRSGKVMRRILRAIAKGEEITQDTSTLENPQVVEEIIAIVNSCEL